MGPDLTVRNYVIRMAHPQEAKSVAQFYRVNKSYLQPWWPIIGAEFMKPVYWQRNLAQYERDFVSGRSVKLFLFSESEIMGLININNIIRGAFHSGTLGYGLAESATGHGLMTEVVAAVVRYGFHDLGLHRIMANYVPENVASGRVLEKVGFVKEGYARDYLLINGKWQDHVLTSITNPSWEN